MTELTVLPAGNQKPAGGPRFDVRKMLPWRQLEQGLTEARQTGKPVFCLAESHFANSAQRLALFLKNDDRLTGLAAEAFVPVMVDADEHPLLVDRILAAASALQEVRSPPLLALLTEEGLPLVTYCHLHFEGSQDRPSLLAMLIATSDHYQRQRKECMVEARGLQLTAPQTAPEGSLFLPAFELWRKPDAARLNLLLRAGVRDQLAGGFHRAGRGPDFGVPHFEKLAAPNAAMAAVLCREGLAEEAEECARFALMCVQEESAGLASETDYYTWNSGEITESLPADELHVAGLHFRVGASSARHVLNQVRPLAECVGLASGLTLESAESLLKAAKSRLLVTRNSRPHPAVLPAPALRSKLTTLRWLFEASRLGCGLLDREELFNRLGKLFASDAQTEDGLRGADGSLRLHDQVAAIGALRSAASLDEKWSTLAAEFEALLRSSYRRAGEWLVSPDGPPLEAGWVDADHPAVQLELQQL